MPLKGANARTGVAPGSPAGWDVRHLFDSRAFPFVFALLYAASFVWIFLIPTAFWDDLSFRNAVDRIGYGYQSGRPLLGYWWAGLAALPAYDHIAHLFVFVAYAAAALAIRCFLAELKILDERERNAIVLLLAVLPVFQSRFLVASTYYTLDYLLFCLGAWLVARGLFRGEIWARIAGNICLLLCFFTDSFVVLAGFLMLLLWVAWVLRADNAPLDIGTWFAGAVSVTRRLPDLVLLPFVYFFGVKSLFPVSGAFQNYNVVTAEGVKDALLHLPFRALVAVFAINADGPSWQAMVGVSAAMAVLLLLLRWYPAAAMSDSKRTVRFYGFAVIVGFCGVMLSIFPYNAIYRYVQPYDFGDANQLTLALSAPAFIGFLIWFLCRDWLKWTAICVAMVWSVAHNITTYADVIMDGHIQNGLVRALRESGEVASHHAFVVDISRYPHLSRQRKYGTAQLNCLMKEAFGDETRFAVAFTQFPFPWDRERAMLQRFIDTGTCYHQYTDEPPVLLTVYPGRGNIDQITSLKMAVMRIKNYAIYQQSLEGLISLNVAPLPPGSIQSASP
ncbi:hypothetical protein [Ferrovibrio xuzhouensis]|uniref:Glycosyltransferase RgtA/B/C/D-like domain-containing protein n=1 Tax=Ferrovibrio xuzhouensis TaxID=1576914 RepID=A0ABV7VF94_9PROT